MGLPVRKLELGKGLTDVGQVVALGDSIKTLKITIADSKDSEALDDNAAARITFELARMETVKPQAWDIAGTPASAVRRAVTSRTMGRVGLLMNCFASRVTANSSSCLRRS